jgi:hypothetical protein
MHTPVPCTHNVDCTTVLLTPVGRTYLGNDILKVSDSTELMEMDPAGGVLRTYMTLYYTIRLVADVWHLYNT